MAGMTDDLWDEWFDIQLKVNQEINEKVNTILEGKANYYKIAMYSSIIESASEKIRMFLDE